MADINCRRRVIIYDYSAYNFAANIPLVGERRYFDTILTGITHPCSVMGDGASQADALPFLELINIEIGVNISLEILRINGNKVMVKNTAGGNITVNLGTAGIPVNIFLAAGNIALFKFNGTSWEDFPEQFRNIHIYSSDARLRIQDDNDIDSFFEIDDVSDVYTNIKKVAKAGNVIIDIDPIPIDETSSAYVRFFRLTNTTGIKQVHFLKGDDTGAVHARIGVDGANSLFQAGGGNLENAGGSVLSGVLTVNADSDAVDVTDVSVIVFDTTGGNITIGGFANGVTGQVIKIIKRSQANDLILEHNEATGTQKLFMNTAADVTLSNFGGTTFIFDFGRWHEINH